jgi:hypothetical protein
VSLYYRKERLPLSPATRLLMSALRVLPDAVVPQPRRAASITATSIFFIVIIASKARFA